MAVWPNGLRTPPKFSSLWKEYKGVPDSTHWGLDSYGYRYNCAIDDAEVIYIGWNTYGGGGREIWYRLGNGDVILYYHNAVDVYVATGDRIVEGQRLGLQSDTGKTFGVHNHTEVWRNGRRDSRVNPLTYIEALVGASPAGEGGSTIVDPPKRRKKSMTTGYYTERNGKTEWAVGGESPGTPANWFTISTQKTANEFAAVHGPFVFLGPTSFDAFAARYLSPLAVAGGVLGGSADLSPILAAVSGVSDQIKQFPTTSVDLSPVLAEIKKLPTADQTAAVVRTKLIAKE